MRLLRRRPRALSGWWRGRARSTLASSLDADVLVVGGGHAGCEAAAAASRAGCTTLLVTQRLTTVGEMSCNPSIGGVGKGHLVREVDAMGGLMASVADEAAIHFRLLNRSKGPAVQGPRVQADRTRYRTTMQATLARVDRLQLVEASVEDLIVEDGAVHGVITAEGISLRARCVVLTTGTFLRGEILIGRTRRAAGRFARATAHGDEGALEVEGASVGVAATLDRLGLPLARLKTGTPPRLDGRTIAWSDLRLSAQPSETPPTFLSYRNALRDSPIAPSVITCFMTHTTDETLRIVRESSHTLPTYQGDGPRYCPSIATKVERFPEARRHQVWLEPEGLDTDLVYPNGISGAYPPEVQARIVASIGGLEHARIVQPAYDVEYEYIDPRAVRHTLEVRACAGLFLAGQILGTTGYEEAAALGLLAGANAALAVRGAPPLVLGREEAYAGVLVDDLVSRGTAEPYRMFTSRAEHRLLLRADNADARLTRRAAEVGLVSPAEVVEYTAKEAAVARGVAALERASVGERALLAEGLVERLPGAPRRADRVLAMPGVSLADVERLLGASGTPAPLVEPVARESVEVLVKYAAFIERQEARVAKAKQAVEAALSLPPWLDFASVPGLSREEVEKLDAARPATLRDAQAISGVTPAAIERLLRHLQRARARRAAAQ